MAKEKAETKATAAKTATTKATAAPAAKKTAEVKVAPKAEAKAAPKAEAKAAPKTAAKAAPKTEAKPALKAEAKTAPKAETKATSKSAPKAETKVEPKEEALVEAKTAFTGKFVIKRTDKGNFVFKLFSTNGRTVAIGTEPYSVLASCKTGIQSVIKNASTAPIEDQTLQKVVEQKCPKWVIYTDKKGEFRLRLIAANGNSVAATNDGYTTKDAAKKGIEVIARSSKNAEIIRNDHLW